MKGNLQEIIYDNRNLIYSIIHRFGGTDFEDLFQAGCIGIIKAYQSFDINLKTKFTTYAYPFIVGEIYSYLNNNRSIRLSPENAKLLFRLKEAEEKLSQYLGKVPTDKEIADFLEIDEYQLAQLRNITKIESLDYQYEENALYDFISDKKIPFENLIDLKDAINSLTPYEKELINNRYFNDITQMDLAKKYHTNQVKIYREEQKILSKLKARMY